jgi:hypothetical protein
VPLRGMLISRAFAAVFRQIDSPGQERHFYATLTVRNRFQEFESRIGFCEIPMPSDFERFSHDVEGTMLTQENDSRIW